jgi:hypothetical protein
MIITCDVKENPGNTACIAWFESYPAVGASGIDAGARTTASVVAIGTAAGTDVPSLEQASPTNPAASKATYTPMRIFENIMFGPSISLDDKTTNMSATASWMTLADRL